MQQGLLQIQLDLLDTLHKQRISLDGILITNIGSVLDVFSVNNIMLFWNITAIETTPVCNTTIIRSQSNKSLNQFNLKHLALDNICFDINNHEREYCVWTNALNSTVKIKQTHEIANWLVNNYDKGRDN